MGEKTSVLFDDIWEGLYYGEKMSKKEFDQIIKDLIGDDKLFGYKNKSNDEKPDEKEFEIPYSEFGLKDCQGSMFDIKQLICHLLGIANQDGRNKNLEVLYTSKK